MAIVNLTPHSIVVRTDDGEKKYEPSNEVVRVETTEEYAGSIDGIPLVTTKPVDIKNLPNCCENCAYSGPTMEFVLCKHELGSDACERHFHPLNIFIVSTMVLEAVKNERSDVVSPDTGSTAIRDDQGRIVAVTRFKR